MIDSIIEMLTSPDRATVALAYRMILNIKRRDGYYNLSICNGKRGGLKALHSLLRNCLIMLPSGHRPYSYDKVWIRSTSSQNEIDYEYSLNRMLKELEYCGII
jgi:hypothetical protein